MLLQSFVYNMNKRGDETDVSLLEKTSKLKLNADKNEFIIIGTLTQCRKLDFSWHIFFMYQDERGDDTKEDGKLF